MKKVLVFGLAAVLAGAVWSAGIVVANPANGSVVSLHSPAQRAFMTKPAAERRRIVDTPELRKPFTRSVDNVPERVKLAWTCEKPGVSDVKYQVRLVRQHDGKVICEEATRQTEVLVDNLEIATDYRWTVSTVTHGGECLSGEGRFRTDDLSPRMIRIKGVANVRDMGGRIGLGGRRTRQGLVYRSSGLNGNALAYYTKDEIVKMYKGGTLLTDVPERSREAAAKIKECLDRKRPDEADLKHLVKEWVPGPARMSERTVANVIKTLGIRTDIDLRSDRECFGMTGSPLGPSVRWVHIPSSRYADMVSEEGKSAFRKVFKVFLDQNNYPIDFHCIAGADRTGSVAYVLGALLGYSDDDLMLDWSLTAMHSGKTDFTHKSRYDKLVEAFAALPGANTCEKAESYVKSLGFADTDVAAFRSIMF